MHEIQQTSIILNTAENEVTSTTPSESNENEPHISTIDTISISKEVYRRLVKCSIDLIKANEKIEK